MPKRGSRRGRPTKHNAELQNAICKQIELGAPLNHAAQAYGVSESTFYEWMQQGAAGAKSFEGFEEAVRCSKSRGVLNLHSRALAGGPGSSQAAWMLSRRFPKEYGAQSSGDADAAPTSLERERAIADSILADPEASKKLHEILAMTVAARKRKARSRKKKP